MIHHITRGAFKPGVTEEQKAEGFASLRNQGEVIPAVRSYLVGPDIGGDYDFASGYVLDDLEGYWEYLMAPAHQHTDEIGLPLLERFVSFDVTDDEDPELPAKIAALHQRRYDERPELVALVQALPSYDGSANPQAGDPA